MGACMSKKALIAEAVIPATKRDSVPVQQKQLAATTSPTDTSNDTDTAKSDNANASASASASTSTSAPPVDTTATATSAVVVPAAQTVTNTPATTTKSLDENITTAAATTTPKSEEEGEQNDREGKNQYQDALNDKLMEMGDKLADHNAKLEDTLLAPVNGVSLEKYATIQAHIAQNSSLYDTILEKNGLTRTEWEAVDQGWQANMRKDAAKGGVATLYGKYYMTAGTGDYGNSGKQAAEVMNIAGVSTGEAPSPGGETDQVPFDKYIEWMGAQGAWSSLGMDVNEMLKKVFNITAHDYSNVSGYWGMKMMSDMNLAMKMGTDLQKWTSAYMTKPYGPDSK